MKIELISRKEYEKRITKPIQFDAEYYKAYHKQLKEKYVALLGGVCVKCNSIDDLQFDHIDRSTKNFVIGKILHYKEEKVLAELSKCQLLCKSCHEEKSASELSGREPWNKGLKIPYKRRRARTERDSSAKGVSAGSTPADASNTST